MRITAAVYEALRPILNEMREDIISSVKSDIMAMRDEIGTLSNHTEEVNTKLSGLNESLREDFDGIERGLTGLNESMKESFGGIERELNGLNESLREDFSGVERELSGLNSTANVICDKIEGHDNQITTELIRMEQTLTREIVYNSEKICGGTWGWRRAVYLDMTDLNTNCPSGWQLTGYSKRTCGRANSSALSCDSVLFPISGGPYSQVCGRIRAYQYGLPLAFYGYNNSGQTTIDNAYFDGVAVMYGSPRQHIWTFANGAWENDTIHHTWNCPCDTNGDIPVPPFVGEDYFCESGYVYPGYRNGNAEYIFHPNDTLWDRRDCPSTSTCCSPHNSPYFIKTLNQTTTDDLELRMCFNDHANFDNIAVELVELYVK